MENNNLPPINPRILIIEIWDNNKICLPAFIPPDDHKISIDELKQALALVNLIIDNPANFHIVRPGFELKKIIIGQSHSNCKKCDVGLLTKSMTERENGICFDCEKKGILDAVNKPLTKEETKSIDFIKNDTDGDCQALNCENKRVACSYFCYVHSNYVGKLKI